MPDNSIRSVRLTTEQVSALLDAMDQQESMEGNELRKFKRLRYRNGKITVHVLEDESTSAFCFRVVARNLSSNGMGFLHGQMLPPGKRVLVELPLKQKNMLYVVARVAYCRHVRAMIHEIGLEFLSFSHAATNRQAAAAS